MGNQNGNMNIEEYGAVVKKAMHDRGVVGLNPVARGFYAKKKMHGLMGDSSRGFYMYFEATFCLVMQGHRHDPN